MSQSVSFKVSLKSLSKGLQLFSKQQSRFHKHTELRISVLPDAIELMALGGSYKIEAETDGLADVTIPSRLLLAYVQTYKGKDISFTVKPGELTCGTSVFASPDITVSGFLTTKESPLPANAKDINVLRVCNGKSKEWLTEYDLSAIYDSAKRRLSAKITEALVHLDEYGISREDLKTLVQAKITDNQSK